MTSADTPTLRTRAELLELLDAYAQGADAYEPESPVAPSWMAAVAKLLREAAALLAQPGEPAMREERGEGDWRAVLIEGEWFARPFRPSSSAGPFQSEEEAWRWIQGEGQAND